MKTITIKQLEYFARVCHTAFSQNQPRLTLAAYLVSERIIEEGEKFKIETNLSGAYLSFANLAGVDLRDIDLTSARLNWADLRDADLRNADLTLAILDSADLRCADLRGANLSSNMRFREYYEKTSYRDAKFAYAKIDDTTIFDQRPIDSINYLIKRHTIIEEASKAKAKKDELSKEAPAKKSSALKNGALFGFGVSALVAVACVFALPAAGLSLIIAGAIAAGVVIAGTVAGGYAGAKAADKVHTDKLATYNKIIGAADKVVSASPTAQASNPTLFERAFNFWTELVTGEKIAASQGRS